MPPNHEKAGETADSTGERPRNRRSRVGEGVARASARGEILDQLEDAIDEAHGKIVNGRVRDAENEKVRQQWIKTLAYAATSYRQLLRDHEIDELRERVERIERDREIEDGVSDDDLLVEGADSVPEEFVGSES